MGDLRDQLKKAKLLSDKEARRLEHQGRVERKKKGRSGLEEERADRERELAALRAGDKARTVKAQKALDRQRAADAERAACAGILAVETRGTGPGNIRWFFQLADGQLPWLEVTPEEQRRLQSGTLSVVRRGPPGTHTYGVLDTELARRVAKVMPDLVVFAPRGVVT